MSWGVSNHRFRAIRERSASGVGNKIPAIFDDRISCAADNDRDNVCANAEDHECYKKHISPAIQSGLSFPSWDTIQL